MKWSVKGFVQNTKQQRDLEKTLDMKMGTGGAPFVVFLSRGMEIIVHAVGIS